MRPSPQHAQPPSAHAQRILSRLDRIGEVLRERGDALALIGLGSVGRDLHRLDEHSDLDFFAVVEDDAKARYLECLDWLDAAAVVAFSFANTADGRKVLFGDGLYAEYAIFTLAQLRRAEYPPGRIVWQRPDTPGGLEVPTRHPHLEEFDVPHQVNEAMTNLFVGLHREARGEGLSAMRLIQVHAVDRILHILELTADDGASRQDLFARERGVERRTAGATCRCRRWCPATGGTPSPPEPCSPGCMPTARSIWTRHCSASSRTSSRTPITVISRRRGPDRGDPGTPRGPASLRGRGRCQRCRRGSGGQGSWCPPGGWPRVGERSAPTFRHFCCHVT